MDARCTNVRGEEKHTYCQPGCARMERKRPAGCKQMVNESRNNGDEMI